MIWNAYSPLKAYSELINKFFMLTPLYSFISFDLSNKRPARNVSRRGTIYRTLVQRCNSSVLVNGHQYVALETKVPSMKLVRNYPVLLDIKSKNPIKYFDTTNSGILLLLLFMVDVNKIGAMCIDECAIWTLDGRLDQIIPFPNVKFAIITWNKDLVLASSSEIRVIDSETHDELLNIRVHVTSLHPTTQDFAVISNGQLKRWNLYTDDEVTY